MSEQPSGPEIQATLRSFIARWTPYAGSEIGEAQTFLNELIACYGTDRHAAGILFEHNLVGAGRADMFWPGRALVEMKAPDHTATLDIDQPQAERYWRASADPGRHPAVRYVVLCSFHRIIVWDMHTDPSRPAANLSLAELPDHYEALLFLVGEGVEASFVEHHRELTRDAAKDVALLYQSLKDRAAAPLDEIQRFIMQSVWTMFAEAIGMLAEYPFQRIVDRLCRERDPNSARDLGYLFRVLNQKGAQNRTGELAGTVFVNGELFQQPAEVGLDQPELQLLARAAAYDWRRVDPTIFGSLLEGVLGRERRWELGAHYTHEADILKIVGPTIVRPWQERIDVIDSPRQGRDLLDELCAFRVLDPACGCGNFLYVAYRELRALEASLKERIRSLAADQGVPVPGAPWPYVALTNMQGIDIERVAVMIARVTLWMGHRQMIDKYGEAEAALPLVTLSGIRQADALRVDWPETDSIIGNPPFYGASKIRSAYGNEYVEWLKSAFGVGVKDFCVYWFRRTHDHLKPGQRGGLVGTNSISQNLGRSASLQYIVESGGTITDAVSSQKWPGEAKVHVSLVNWTKGESVVVPLLDGVEVQKIGASLRVTPAWDPRVLAANDARCFEGPSPKASGLVLSHDVASTLIANDEAEYSGVIRPYLTAEDIADSPQQSPSRWAVDFGLRTLEEANRYPAAMQIVRRDVLPVREGPTQTQYRARWWQFGRPRPSLRIAVAPLTRYVAMARHGKRAVYCWQTPEVLASDATKVFAFDDNFSMSVLLSRTHGVWAWFRSSTWKSDLRYTNTTVFMTFPWPDQATEALREAAAEACHRLLARRSEVCLSENIGLTTLYNRIDEGAYADVQALHRALDEAVAECYGWPKSVAQHDAELVTRLTELNRQISEGERAYDPFAYLR